MNDDISAYLRDVSRFPLLSADEEAELGRSAVRGRQARERLAGAGAGLDPDEEAQLRSWAAEGDAARRRLVEGNWRLAVSIAKQYRGRGLDMSDLVAEANLGLVRAAREFDPDRGRFVMLATPWIRGLILRAIRARRATPPASPLPVVDPPDPRPGPAGAAIGAERDARDARWIAAALRRMVPPQREVARRLYGLGGEGRRTLDEIAADLGMPKSRAMQHSRDAMGPLGLEPGASPVKGLRREAG